MCQHYDVVEIAPQGRDKANVLDCVSVFDSLNVSSG